MSRCHSLHFSSSISPWFSRSRRRILLAATAISLVGCSSGWAADGEVSDAVLKKMEAMEKRIQSLEAELKQKRTADVTGSVSSAEKKRTSTPEKTQDKTPDKTQAPEADKGAKVATAAPEAPQAPKSKPSSKPKTLDLSTPPSDLPILGLAPSPVAGLSIGAYGEVKFGSQQNPAANGQWQNGFDTARMVLLPTYAITDNIIFNAEIEFEHAGAGFDNDDKLHGTAEIEQLWIDFKIIDQFNWRSPGIDLVPIGWINQHHEPTQFYMVNRPELYNSIIP